MEKEKSKYKKGKLKERKANWKETYASVEDIQRYLEDHVVLRHNVVTGKTEYRLPGSDDYRPMDDRMENTLWKDMMQEKPVRIQDMQRVMESDFVPDYHPFRHYLDQLPRWDGKSDYLLSLSATVLMKGDVEEQMLFYNYLTKWFVGMVASWVDDTVVNNVILVLIGAQGTYKTTWFNYLLPPELRQYFFTKTNSGLMTKDDKLVMAEYALICCEELDTMRPSELNQLKAAVTMPSINERAAYARHHENRKHVASFCGTGNNMQFLSDPTGNRRWLPFEVDFIMSPRDNPLDYEAIYSQAYALYREGFQYWFTQEEIVRLAKHNRQFETPRLEAELVDIYFRHPTEHEPGEFMPVGRALQIIGGNTTQKLSSVQLGRAFTEQGFKQVRRASSRGYIVVQRDANEIRSYLQQNASDR